MRTYLNYKLLNLDTETLISKVYICEHLLMRIPAELFLWNLDVLFF